jgi:tetratricopeptide (TPR) repeat protein
MAAVRFDRPAMKFRAAVPGTAAAPLAVVLLVSCAAVMPPLEVDPSARAPQLQGYGHSAIAVTTPVDEARRLFNEGVLQAYAFNEVEAVRTFKAALAKDPACPMCAWGVAWQLGPNINNSGRDGAAEALKYVDHALRNAARATPRERALIESLALRYAHASVARETAPLTAVCGSKDGDDEKVHPLDAAYADRMRSLADAHPADPDIVSLYAEAEIIATEGSTGWHKDGKPVGRMGEAADRVERLLPAHTSHIGLNHYLIHLADALPVASRALPAAERLGKLAPQSPHLVHMPSHIFVHVGRFADAAQVNEQAVAADIALTDALKSQGFSVSKDWRGHNQHFLWYAAIMAGREDQALATADAMAARFKEQQGAFFEFVRSMRLITLVRMERWEQLLQEPLPMGDRGVAQVWYEYARGIAQARLGRPGEAETSLTRLQAAATATRARMTGNTGPQRTARAMVEAAEAGLRAELALAQGKPDDAFKHQAAMMKATARLDAREPPMLADGTRLSLGDMQARAGRWRDAEASFREALAEHPGSGWALRGLAQALRAQGKQTEADAVRRELERQWRLASPHLRAPA